MTNAQSGLEITFKSGAKAFISQGNNEVVTDAKTDRTDNIVVGNLQAVLTSWIAGEKGRKDLTSLGSPAGLDLSEVVMVSLRPLGTDQNFQNGVDQARNGFNGQYQHGAQYQGNGVDNNWNGQYRNGAGFQNGHGFQHGFNGHYDGVRMGETAQPQSGYLHGFTQADEVKRISDAEVAASAAAASPAPKQAV